MYKKRGVNIFKLNLLYFVAIFLLSGCWDATADYERPQSHEADATNSSRYGEHLFGYANLPEKTYSHFDLYKLGFNENGVPGKMENNGWVEHPMYAAYLMMEYISAYKNSNAKKRFRDQTYLDSAEKIASVAISRMAQKKGALVYYYKKGFVKTQFEHEFYSGLTSSNYLTGFTRLYRITQNPKYREVARRIYKSLSLPQESGGVAIYANEGVHIEEYPSSPTLWTLNGWITAINAIYAYYELTGDEDVLAFANQNVKLIEAKIHLFDVESVLNTRYQLANPYYIKIIAKNWVSLEEAIYSIPGASEYKLQIDKVKPKGTRMNYSIRRCDHCNFEDQTTPIFKGILLLNVVGSLASYPEENFLSYKLKTSGNNKISFFVAQGDYNPQTTAMPTRSWELLSEINIPSTNNPGPTAIEGKVNIEKKYMEIIAYPTNFKKKFEGKNFNAYHFIHIGGLKKINEWRNSKVLEKYIKKWEGYTMKWPESDIYMKKDLELKSIRQFIDEKEKEKNTASKLGISLFLNNSNLEH